MLPQLIIARAAMAHTRPDLARHAAMNCTLRRWVEGCGRALRRLARQTPRRDMPTTAKGNTR